MAVEPSRLVARSPLSLVDLPAELGFQSVTADVWRLRAPLQSSTWERIQPEFTHSLHKGWQQTVKLRYIEGTSPIALAITGRGGLTSAEAGLWYQGLSDQITRGTTS